MSNETAKRYYDCQTKLEQFSEGHLLYIHDPTYKRRKAKQFSYQYKGHFEVKQKTSPLIYKVQLPDGTFAIIHINRLKQAYGLVNGSKASPTKTKPSEIVKTRQSSEVVYKNDVDSAEIGELDLGSKPIHTRQIQMIRNQVRLKV